MNWTKMNSVKTLEVTTQISFMHQPETNDTGKNMTRLGSCPSTDSSSFFNWEIKLAVH